LLTCRRCHHHHADFVKKIDGAGAAEHALSTAMHYALYGFMIVMPASGIAMGYYGGKGLPFFTTTIAGAKEVNGEIAKNVRDSLPCRSTRLVKHTLHHSD
jgi:cytochrome b561